MLQLDDDLTRGLTALAIVLAGVLGGKVVRTVLRHRFESTRTPSFASVVPKLVGTGVVLTSLIVATTLAFPSVRPVDLIAGAGVFSIAIGFAFQDILSNLLAGLLLIIRQPFISGDQIDVGGWTGTVEEITIRETRIRTFDGERVVIPNADVYQSAIRIQTAFAARRTTVLVGVGYDTDLDEAAQVVLDALASVAGVDAEPAPEVLATRFGDSAIDLEIRFWSAPQQLEARRVQHAVIRAVKAGLDDAGIDIPFPIQTVLTGPGTEDATAHPERLAPTRA